MNSALKTPTQTTGSSEPDRLSHALFFANKLNDSRLWKIKISYQKRWTHLKRVQKSQSIQYVRPWLAATGPKTMAGKGRSCVNAARTSDIYRAFYRALRDQRRYIRKIVHALQLPFDPERDKKLKIEGAIVTANLLACLARGRLVTDRNNQ